jgi:hypothetical protein
MTCEGFGSLKDARAAYVRLLAEQASAEAALSPDERAKAAADRAWREGQPERERVARLERAWEGMGIPDQYCAVTFGMHPTPSGAERAVAKFLAAGDAVEPGRCLVLYGGTGQGKDEAVAALLNTMAATDVFGIWLRWPVWVRHASNPYERDDAYARAYSHRLVYFEDFGRAYLGREEQCAARMAAGEAIAYRYEHQLPTILSMNLAPSTIGDDLGEFALSRITSAWGVLCELTDRDYRMDHPAAQWRF